jgi:hypothetical protein
VTSTNWSRYKILTMEETPEIEVVQISRDDKGFGGGSEAANAVALPRPSLPRSSMQPGYNFAGSHSHPGM